MKLSIAWRLGLVLAGVSILGAGMTGYFAYQANRDHLVKASEDRLLTATRVLMRQVTVALNDIAADAGLVARHPQSGRILQRSLPDFQTLGENNVAELFKGMMQVHPEYFQIRLIETDHHGQERIRVDRDLTSLLRITGDGLQEKGHFAYVFETTQLPPGAVFVSRAAINHESGAHAGAEQPSLQVAAPTHDRQGKAIGLVVINVDLNRLFAQLASDLPPEFKLYLANSRGDFLIHPDPARRFAFDRGKKALIQTEFPAAALLSGQPSPRDFAVTSKPAANGAPDLVATFVHQSLAGLAAEEDFILGLSQPLASVLQDSRHLALQILGIVSGFSALAILLAALLARALSRPLRHIVDEIRRFTAQGKIGALPVARNDEVGELARSIEQMEMQINQQIENLHAQREALDHLASYDALTGLPNRRLFLERLDLALARARRQKTRFALFFIDLDGFKETNDSHGHDAGDRVLQTVAERLGMIVRETDIAARLGGDEFVVLVEDIGDEAAIAQIRDKLKTSLSRPVPYRDIALQSDGSIGIACYPQDGDSTAALISAADSAMYRHKTGKR